MGHESNNEELKMMKAKIYRGIMYPVWLWVLYNRNNTILCSSSEDFKTYAGCKSNLERITGGKFIGMKDNEDQYRGVIERC
jgi:hypothetical protein